MSGLSVALKRKSIEKADPNVPKTLKIREPSATGRTLYQNFKPAQALKDFKKKQLYTHANLSTEKSQSNLNNQDFVIMKQSRFDDDHHNTESIQQLLDTKMISNLPSGRSKIQQMKKKSIPHSQEKLTSQKQSLQSDSLVKDDEHQVLSKQRQESKQENVQEAQVYIKQNENYDDYVLGDRIQQKQQCEETKGKYAKKYGIDHNILKAAESSQSLARADYIRLNNQRKKFNQLKEDQEIASLMQKYKNNKQSLLNHSNRRHQTQRIMVSISKPPQIQKSCSLPQLKAKREVQVPEIQPKNQDKLTRNILGKDTKKYKNNSSHLIQSLSSGKLGFGRKKIRTISQQEIYQDDMKTLEEVKAKLRSKGIVIDANKLNKGLVNIKNQFQYEKVAFYPQKKLLSNPIYKKFPL